MSHYIFEIITPSSITKAMSGYFMLGNLGAKTIKIALSCMNLQQLIFLVLYIFENEKFYSRVGLVCCVVNEKSKR